MTQTHAGKHLRCKKSRYYLSRHFLPMRVALQRAWEKSASVLAQEMHQHATH